MICGPCKEKSHGRCFNLSKLGVALSTWCDCQHRQPDEEARAEAINRQRIAAVVARQKPRPMVSD